jgi:bla regulator protein blaR1
MLTWMLYVFVITLLLSGAAFAAEYSARLRHGRTRWIWAVTIVASLVIPALVASVSIQIPSLLTPTVARKITPLRELTRVQVVPLTWVHEHTRNVAAARSENNLLQRTWIGVSVALLAGLALNGAQVFWRKRRWKLGTLAGVSVYIAQDAGPAVVGLLRPRIVVPEWLTRASRSHQTIVLAHEQAHLGAHDPQLLTVALCLIVLMPWNLPLWWQLHRLRCAIEVDCDARVLHAGLDAAEYGETLIDVSQQPSGYIGSVAAMSESRSFLERRIAIMARTPGKCGPAAAAIFGCLAVALVAVATQVTPPNSAASDGRERTVALTPPAFDQFVGLYLRGANIVIPITREGDHLLLHWNKLLVELVATADMTFLPKYSVGGPPALTFMRDASGRVTGALCQFGNLFSLPIARIDASDAETVRVNNEARAVNQTPMPGSDVALRRLIDGVLAGEPHYDEMTPWYAELVRQASPIARSTYGPRGAVRSIVFRHVDKNGGDVYEVNQEGGFSMWVIYLNSNGLIEDADDSSGNL